VSGPGPADLADRERISRSGLDRTLFVEAGAGTGKTTQLVERICNLVVHEGVPLSAVAAITFTEAAATELRSRIRVEFERRSRAGTHLGEVAACEAALADADRAAITTLHGFAARILGEFAVAAALPPRVRVLDEVSSQLATEQRWERFVDGLYADPSLDELLTRAAVFGVPVEPQGLRQGLREVAAQFNQNWDLLDAIAERSLPPLRPVDFRPIEVAVDALEALLGSCSDPEDRLVNQMEAAVRTVRAMLAVEPDARLEALVAVHEERIGKGKLGRKENWADIEAVRTAKVRLTDTIGAVRARTIDEVLNHLGVLTARFVLEGARQRRAEGGLEFHDLLVLARDLLRTNHDVRRVLHERYRHLLLDEFQDTDPIQIELAVLIVTAIAQPEADGWDHLMVPDGSLFFVGDPKQSIYRFRRADIELFLRARDRFGGGGDLARLTTNFRTVEPVLDWVNALFGECMADEIAGRQPAYTPLHAHRRADSGVDHRPLLLGGPHPDTKVRASALREAEASDVACTIARILAEPEQWPVHDGAPGGWRPAEPGDITILLPTRTSLPFLRDALDAAGIGYRLATGTLVYDTQEVRDVLAVLRAVDDPTDEISLVAALRSPLYACSDVDLFTFREAGGRWDLRSSPPPALAGVDHPVLAAFAHLRDLWEQRWWRTPSAMVAQLLADRHGFLLGFGASRPADVWKRLRFLVDQARLFEEAGGGGLRAFVE